MPAKRSNLVKPFLQVAFLSLGLLCALSRIFDYWHHWGDVLVGMFLGAIVAFFIVSFWSDILRMDHYFFEVGVGQFPKKIHARGAMVKKIEQVLSTILVLYYVMLKNCYAIYSHQNISYITKRWGKKFPAPENCPEPSSLKKVIVCLLVSCCMFYLISYIHVVMVVPRKIHTTSMEVLLKTARRKGGGGSKPRFLWRWTKLCKGIGGFKSTNLLQKHFGCFLEQHN